MPTKQRDRRLSEDYRATGETGASSKASFQQTMIPSVLPVVLYVKKDDIHVKIVHGNIAESGAECIVNSAPEELLNDHGCAGMLKEAGGANLKAICDDHIKKHGRLKPGDVVVTDAGELPCKKIIHACGPSWDIPCFWPIFMRRSRGLLVRTLDRCLNEAKFYGSIAIPGISAGLAGKMTNPVAEAICQSVTTFCKTTREPGFHLNHILLVDVNESMVQAFVNAFGRAADKGTFQQIESDEEGTSSRRELGVNCGRIHSTTNHKVNLPGYPDCGTITIVYDIPSGIQSKDDPNPGNPYEGVRRTAYLPFNKQGKRILGGMEEAFNKGLIFAIGQSESTKKRDVIIWSGNVSHRTNQTGGPAKYGYPDEDYLDKVEKELRELGMELI